MRETLFKLAAWTSLLLAISGCGGGREAGQLSVQTGLSAGDAAQSAAGEISPQTLRMLNAALEDELQHIELRTGSSAPLHESSRVTDLRLSETVSGQLDFAWSLKLAGDYDANGIVNASDLVPLGQHFGKKTNDLDYPYGKLIDGDANGEIGLSDIVPIAQNFLARCDGFELQGSSTGGAGAVWTTILDYPAAQSVADPQTARRSFICEAVPASHEHFRLLPYVDEADGSRQFGLASNVVFNYQGLSAPESWSTTGGSNTRKNYAAAVGPDEMELLWRSEDYHELSGSGLSAPVLSQDGTAFAVDYQRHVVAFNADGSQQWLCDINSPPYKYFLRPQSLMMCSDGRLLLDCSARDGQDALVSVSPHGTVIEILDFAEELSLPAEHPNGYFYCASFSGIVRFDKSATELLSLDLGANNFNPAAPVITESGQILVYGNRVAADLKGNDGLALVSPDLEHIWGKKLGDSLQGMPAVSPEGNIYLSLDESGIYCLDPAGNELWNYEVNTVSGPVGLRADGSALFSVYGDPLVPDDFSLLCISGQGQALWASPNEVDWGSRLRIPLSDASGKVYCCTEDATVVCLSPSGDKLWQCKLVPDNNGSSVPAGLAMSESGELFVAHRGRMWCFAEGGKALPAPPGKITGKANSDNVELSWDAQAGALGYLVYEDTDKPRLIARLDDQQATHLTDYRTYSASIQSYLISSYNELGEGALSGAVSLEIPPLKIDNEGAGDWAQSAHDSRNSFRSNIHGPAQPAELWRYSAHVPDKHSGAPVCSANGHLYFKDEESLLTCLSPAGSKLWRFGPGIQDAPALAPDGSIVVNLYTHAESLGGDQVSRHSVLALSPSRGLRWKKDFGYHSRFKVSRDGRTVVDNDSDGLVLLDTDGNILWQRLDHLYDQSSYQFVDVPAVSDTGLIFISKFSYVNQLRVLAFDFAGNVVLDKSNISPVMFSPRGYTIRDDGSLLTDGAGILSLADGDFEIITTIANNGSRPALLSGGSFINTSDNPPAFNVYAKDGALKQSRALPSVVTSSLAIDAGGRVYFGMTNSQLVCMDTEGAVLWSHDANAGAIHSLAIGDDGRLFVSAEDGLIAFGDS